MPYLGCFPCWWNCDRQALAAKYGVNDPFEGCSGCCLFYLGCHSCLLIQELKCVFFLIPPRPPVPARAPCVTNKPSFFSPFRSHVKAVQLAGGLQQNQVVVITQAPAQQQMYAPQPGQPQYAPQQQMYNSSA